MTRWMKAARLHNPRSKLSIDRIQVPRIRAGEVLVDVQVSGLCHSDINYRDGVAPVAKLPITLGHEIAGVVAEIGGRVKGVKEGDRVFVHYISSCGRCVYCRNGRENYCPEYSMIGKDIDGGFAEYARIPATSIVKLPEAIPFEQGAIMGCAVPTAYHALKRSNVKPKDTVLILGVGGLGMHAVQLAKTIFNAGKIIAVDRFTWKLNKAKRFGAERHNKRGDTRRCQHSGKDHEQETCRCRTGFCRLAENYSAGPQLCRERRKVSFSRHRRQDIPSVALQDDNWKRNADHRSKRPFENGTHSTRRLCTFRPVRSLTFRNAPHTPRRHQHWFPNPRRRTRETNQNRRIKELLKKALG